MKALVATSNPSTADRTEMAGVIIPSPYNRAAPKRPRKTSVTVLRGAVCFARRDTSAINASTPPSPSLSARMTNRRYLTEMTRSNDQTTSDSKPRMLGAVASTPWGGVTHSRRA